MRVTSRGESTQGKHTSEPSKLEPYCRGNRIYVHHVVDSISLGDLLYHHSTLSEHHRLRFANYLPYEYE